MNRIFKFRAFDKETNEMIFDFGINKRYNILQKEEGDLFCGGIALNGDWNEPVLMQFTGLKDKNGKEVYEGDIVSGCHFNGSYAHGVITFYKGGFVAFPISKDIEGLDYINQNIVELIGNIYENPELAEKLYLPI